MTAASDNQEPGNLYQNEILSRMTLGEHLDELRRRVFYASIGLGLAMVLSLVLGREILLAVEMPFKMAMTDLGLPIGLKTLSVAGPFTLYLKLALYGGIVLSSPWIFYQLWMFVAAGLYPGERKYVTLAIPFSALLFFCGSAFAVVISIPAIKFFVNFGNSMGIEPIITLGEYVDFMTDLVLAFGIVFQMPLAVLVLTKVGLVDMSMLRHYRRHVVVGICVVAAILAPPDVLSMIAMAAPMWLLYELGVILAWVLVLREKDSR